MAAQLLAGLTDDLTFLGLRPTAISPTFLMVLGDMIGLLTQTGHCSANARRLDWKAENLDHGDSFHGQHNKSSKSMRWVNGASLRSRRPLVATEHRGLDGSRYNSARMLEVAEKIGALNQAMSLDSLYSLTTTE